MKNTNKHIMIYLHIISIVFILKCKAKKIDA